MPREVLYKIALLVLLSSLQLGQLQEEGCAVFQSINSNLELLEGLILAQNQETISLRADLSSLNDSVSNLSMCLQEHEEQAAADVNQLNSKLDALAIIQQCGSQQDSPTQTTTATTTTTSTTSILTVTTPTIMTTPTTPTSTVTTPTTTTTPTTPNPTVATPRQEEGTDVNDMFRNINSNLAQLKSLVISQIREIMSLRGDMSSLNGSVSNLSVCFQEHKQQTAADMQQLNSRLDTLTTIQQCDSQQDIPTQMTTATTTMILATPTTPTPTATTPTIPRHTCGHTEGWRRVVYLDMTDPSTTCPSGWNMTGYSKRTCGRATNGSLTCDSVTFSVSGGEYNRVCGMIKAYQWAGPHAFYTYHHGYVTTIDGAYVDGISVTHSSPRQHIWTFAAGAAEGGPNVDWVCPCDVSRTIRVPPFVGNDYFCESGVNEPWDYSRHYTLHPNDTLWDGRDCLSSSTCCSLHNPPYFVKQLPTPSTDHIEARICMDTYKALENIAVELVELYVQ